MELYDKLQYCKSFFEEYIASFEVRDPGHIKNFAIKKGHSYRVVEIIEYISRKLGIEEEELVLASLIALLHDIGRFPQLVKYNTFNDETSVDHAWLSVEVIKEQGLLDELDEKLAGTVYTAISLHNKFELPNKMDENHKFFSKLIRDADKIDILKVIIDYYENKDRIPNHTLTWELPVGEGISEKVAKAAINGELVSKELVKTQNDIKVMQMSWVYDLHFKPSFQLISEKRYIDKIYNTLPKRDDVIEIYRSIKIYLENQFMKQGI